jgi:hypothetical protein
MDKAFHGGRALPQILGKRNRGRMKRPQIAQLQPLRMSLWERFELATKIGATLGAVLVGAAAFINAVLPLPR